MATQHSSVLDQADTSVKNIITGTDGFDDLTGTAGVDFIYGLAGGDIIAGLEGHDMLDGASGDDWMRGGTGQDVLRGGAGDDVLFGEGGMDKLYGNTGADFLDGGWGADLMYGGSNNDTYVVNDVSDQAIEVNNSGRNWDEVYASVSFTLGANIESLVLVGSGDTNGTGNELDNTLYGNNGVNTLVGGAGDDVIYAGGDDAIDTLAGGTGKDEYYIAGDVVVEQAGQGYDTVYSDDSWTMSEHVEALYGFGGTEFIGNGTDNFIVSYSWEEGARVEGRGGDDEIYIEYGIADGGAGNDILQLWNSVDNIGIGGEGDDLVFMGFDGVVTGGAGADSFRFQYYYDVFPDFDGPVLTDFESGVDSIGFLASEFGYEAAGPVAAEDFLAGSGAAAQTEAQRFIFDTDTGRLYYDSDGSGETEQYLIATLSGTTSLSHSDLYLYAEA